MMTISEVLRWASARLESVTNRPRLEAELLMAHLLQQPRISLHAHPETPLTPDQTSTYAALVERRAGHEPLPYITGHIEFYGRDFTVTPDVLIPRLETELLIEKALDWLDAHEVTRAVDVGTGSGCIAVTLAREVPTLRFVATDLSAEALHVARANAGSHGVAVRVRCMQADLLAPLLGPFDLIVSNPPYVAHEEWTALPASVRREPRLALLAGSEGLDAVRSLLAQAKTRLRAGGLLLMEIGETQGGDVCALAKSIFPQADVRVLQDLAGKDRLLRIKMS